VPTDVTRGSRSFAFWIYKLGVGTIYLLITPMTTKKLIPLSALILLTAAFAFAQKPKLTLDEFFNSVSFPSVEISPDGNSVAIVAERADWDQQVFRKDLWLYRDDAKGSSLIQLTQSDV